MERMTEYTWVGGYPRVMPIVDEEQAMKCLFDYENTNLTPSEVRRISVVLADIAADYNCSFDFVKNHFLDNVQRTTPVAPRKANYAVEINGYLTMLDENEFFKCPSCRFQDTKLRSGQKYCHECGQRLDWSDIT